MKTLKIIYNGFYNHKNKLKIVDELYEKYNWKRNVPWSKT